MKKIYLISPEKLDTKFYSFLPKILKTRKVKFLQIRCKKLPKKHLIKNIKKIIPYTKKYKVKLIINDDASHVASIKNLGFHLGQRDLKKKSNQREIRNKKNFFGITCHNSLMLASSAKKIGASYIAFGAFHETKTKKIKYRADVSILKKAKKLNLDIVAIGGIDNKNYKNLIKQGANYVAVSSFIWRNKDYNPLEAVKLFK